jgi:hypothetical protein
MLQMILCQYCNLISQFYLILLVTLDMSEQSAMS